MNDNLTKLNLGFERSKLLRTKLNCKLMKLNEEVTKMGRKTYSIIFFFFFFFFLLHFGVVDKIENIKLCLILGVKKHLTLFIIYNFLQNDLVIFIF